MQMSRDEISKYDTEHTLIKREIELTRTNLQESLAMNEMEQKNVMYMRKKLEELKEEQRLVQNDLMLTKDELLKEDGKLRATKSLATDQLRLLQIDLNKIQNEFKSKQRAIDDLEKYRKAIEDETEIKRRDAETHLATLMREVDEETRKLSDVKSELRVGRLEVEQLVSKRRTLSTELARVGDALAIETNKLEAEEADAKRRLELLDRQLSDGEKNSRAIREKVSTFENEQILLRHSVDDLRRQQAELQRAAEMRRRAADEELNQSQLQAQLASRAARQATAQAEQKKAELEALEAELRTTARRYEEIKRQVREQEVILDTHRDAIKSIDQDRERVRKDSISIRKEEEELRYQSQLLRATIDNDTRALEDLRRRMTTLQDDEVNLKENEQKLKVSVASLRKAIEDSRTELDENRLASERERRALADLRTKKMMIESDLNRTEEECKFVHEQTSAESMKKNEVQSALIHAREEINRTQKELFLMQKKVADAKRLEEDLLHREEELKIQQEKLRVETEGWNTTLSNEKINVEKLREENRELMASLRSNAEELRAVQQELMSNKAELDGIKQHFNHFENLKLSLTKDLNRIRDSYRLEIKKMENLQDNYNSVEKQLKMLKSELEKMEQLYAKTRSLTIDEEERVNEQKRLLKATTYELSKLENEIASANKQMYEERQRALVEISQLGYAKQTAQQQLFLSSEAQKRIDKKSSSSSIADRAGSPPKVNSSKDFLVSKITNKLYPTNPKLSTTGVPLSASYSDYNSPFDTNTDLGFKSTAYSDSFPPRVIPLVNSRTISVERNRNNSSDVDKGGEVISSKNYAENFSESVGINDDEIELGSLQREVEKLRQQSAAVLNSTRK